MSMAFNKVMIMGNLTRDPQVKQLPSNTTVVEFGLAVSRKFKTAAGEDREEVCFVDCSAFGRQAETIANFCTKGKPLFIEGRLKYDTWDDKNGSGKRSKLSVVVENFQFLPSNRGESEDESGARRTSQPTGSQRPVARRDPREEQRQRNAAPIEKPFCDEQQFQDSDIPF